MVKRYTYEDGCYYDKDGWSPEGMPLVSAADYDALAAERELCYEKYIAHRNQRDALAAERELCYEKYIAHRNQRDALAAELAATSKWYVDLQVGAGKLQDRIAQLEAALRELYDRSPYLAEGELTERIDALLGSSVETPQCDCPIYEKRHRVGCPQSQNASIKETK